VVEIWDKVNNTFKLLAGNPIFDGTNFLPADTLTERIRVTNYTSENQTVGLEVKNFDKGCIDSYCLADKLYLTVGEPGNSSLYSGSLTDFYEAGEIPLSGVNASGGNVQYDFSVSFDKDTTAKEYQGSTTNFDLEIGFFTKETVSGEPFGGGGGYIPPIPGVVTTITISGPTTLTSGSATISWVTDISSYCRVIYDDASHFTLGDPPNYGYDLSTGSTSTKTTSHSMTLTELVPGMTYFYRVVCWASPEKISEEYSFTTLGVKIEELIPSEEEIVPPEEEILAEEVVLAPTGEEETPKESKLPTGQVEKPSEGVTEEEEVEERTLGEVFAAEGLLAAIGALPFNLKVILILVGIIIVGLLILWLIRKRKIKK